MKPLVFLLTMFCCATLNQIQVTLCQAQAFDIQLVEPNGFPGGFGFRGNGGPVLQLAIANQDTELPDDAAELVKDTDADLAKLQKQADDEKTFIQRKVDAVKRVRRARAIAALQLLQDKYTVQKKLDEAVAIRNRIRQLKIADQPVYRDPGSVRSLDGKVGTTYLFEVTGSISGSLWGTEVYTADSSIAKAVVHMGILKPGEKGIIKVTLVESPPQHEGSDKNGVTSNAWSSYAFSYTVEPSRDALSE